MAEVLASKLADLDNLTDGDGFTYSWFDMERPDLARELTDALTAAGFGLVADAKADAWDEGRRVGQAPPVQLPHLKPDPKQPLQDVGMIYPTDCAECGHPEGHHDAGECWTDASGLECSGGSVCPCGWYEPVGDQ